MGLKLWVRLFAHESQWGCYLGDMLRHAEKGNWEVWKWGKEEEDVCELQGALTEAIRKLSLEGECRRALEIGTSKNRH